MSISKEELNNLVYKRKQIGTKVVQNLRQPSEFEIEECRQKVDKLIDFIVQKHS